MIPEIFSGLPNMSVIEYVWIWWVLIVVYQVIMHIYVNLTRFQPLWRHMWRHAAKMAQIDPNLISSQFPEREHAVWAQERLPKCIIEKVGKNTYELLQCAFSGCLYQKSAGHPFLIFFKYFKVPKSMVLQSLSGIRHGSVEIFLDYSIARI